MALLDDLEAQVTRDKDVKHSAVTLLTGLKAKLDAAGTDATKLAALSAALGAETTALSEAIVANTPAETA